MASQHEEGRALPQQAENPNSNLAPSLPCCPKPRDLDAQISFQQRSSVLEYRAYAEGTGLMALPRAQECIASSPSVLQPQERWVKAPQAREAEEVSQTVV